MAGDDGVDAPSPRWRHRLCSRRIPTRTATGETPDPVISDRTVAASMSLSLLGALFWSSGRMEVARSGAVYFYIVDNTDSRRHGAAESLCRMYVVGLAQGGGVVWHRGDVDSRPGNVIASITQEDGSVEDGGSGASACVALCLLDRARLQPITKYRRENKPGMMITL